MVDRQMCKLLDVHLAGFIQLTELIISNLGASHPGISTITRQGSAVLLCRYPACRRFNPHRQILGHQNHIVTLLLQILGHCQNSGVIVSQTETCWQGLHILMIKLYVNVPTFITNGQTLGQVPMDFSQLIQHPQCLTSKKAKLRVMALGFQLRNDNDGQNNVMLCEPGQRHRI